MALKDYPRVHYRNNPLVEVVCQLRFPRILSIDGEVPFTFQNKISTQYPNLQTANEYQQKFSVDMTDDNPMPRITQNEKRPNYAFLSGDTKWKVNLTSTFLSLSTLQYASWEEFREKLTLLIGDFLEIYSPPFNWYERVGLRYIDVLTRSKLDLKDTDWNELLHPFALGFLSNPNIKDNVKSFACSTEIDVGNNAFARINTSLGYVNSKNNQLPLRGQELSLIIDSDIFAFKVNKETLLQQLEYTHKISTNILRSIITEKMHKAMEPEEV